MIDEKERVLDLVARGKLDVNDANELIKSLERPRQGLSAWLVNPLERTSLPLSLGLSAVTVLVGAALSLGNLRFDGALDIHMSSKATVSLREAALDAAVSWPLTAATLWIMALAVARRGRPVDFLAAVGLARLPSVLGGAALLAIHPLAASSGSAPSLWVMTLITVLAMSAITGTVTLLFVGYRTASGLGGAKLVLSFNAAIALAEALSKIILRVTT
jgi:hypothetical protein